MAIRSIQLGVLSALIVSTTAFAQRAEENAVTSANDAFGRRVGSEQIGLYGPGNVRGFSAISAQNVRIEGLYFDRQAPFTSAIEESSSIKVGISALGYSFPAPTGIVDYSLRRVGDGQVISARAGFGDFVAPFLSVDAALPLTSTLDLNIGVGFEEFATSDGSDFYVARYGGVARWQPTENLELAGFYGRYDYWDEEQAPTYFTGGSFLPPRIARGKFFGQDWAEWAGHAQNYGFMAKSAFGPWELNAGVFNSRFAIDDFGAALFTNTQLDGIAEKRFLLGENQRDASTSGEIQIIRNFVHGPRLHRIIGSLRGRRVNNDFGGFDAATLGPGPIDVTSNEPEPDVSFGELTEDRIRLWTGALGYELRWKNRVELSAGVQRTSYEQTVTLPGEPGTSTNDDPWLWNASVAFTGLENLVIYAASTRGLEESGTAPQNAANANQTLPALRTEQVESGIRYSLPYNMRLVAGFFDVRRPYFELDTSDSVFRVLGEVRHRGAELSLSGSPTPGLDLVFGAVLLDPRVTGEAVDDGRLGRRPLGPIETVLDARVNYRLPGFNRLSLDAGIAYTGDRVARLDNTLEIPKRTIIDLGARYRFQVAGAPALLRVQLGNLTNEFGWRVSSGGGFRYEPQRRLSMTLTVDY
ncbi:MAG: TonB-dependent receptor [Pseudomonadota bacterium]